MLRISIHENLESLTFQLEGIGRPLGREVEECGQRTLARPPWAGRSL